MPTRPKPRGYCSLNDPWRGSECAAVSQIFAQWTKNGAAAMRRWLTGRGQPDHEVLCHRPGRLQVAAHLGEGEDACAECECLFEGVGDHEHHYAVVLPHRADELIRTVWQ